MNKTDAQPTSQEHPEKGRHQEEEKKEEATDNGRTIGAHTQTHVCTYDYHHYAHSQSMKCMYLTFFTAVFLLPSLLLLSHFRDQAGFQRRRLQSSR